MRKFSVVEPHPTCAWEFRTPNVGDLARSDLMDECQDTRHVIILEKFEVAIVFAEKWVRLQVLTRTLRFLVYNESAKMTTLHKRMDTLRCTTEWTRVTLG